MNHPNDLPALDEFEVITTPPPPKTDDEDKEDNDDEGNFAGYRCPACERGDCLDIQALVWVRLTDIGSDDFESHDGSHEWDRSSPCTCTNCDWEGTVAGLKEE